MTGPGIPLMMKEYAVFLFLPFLIFSCVSAPGGDRDNTVDHLKAENRMMKRNQNLALRENEVLKIENLKFKAQSDTLSDEVSRLMGELRTANETYETDMDRMNAEYEELCSCHETLERESEALIGNLTAINQDLEKNHAADTARLNDRLKDQTAAFQSEREALKGEFASQMAEMNRQLAAVEQTLREKEAEILVLTEQLKAATAAAAHLETAFKETKDALARKEMENAELLAAARKLEAEIAEKKAYINALPAYFRLNVEQSPTESPLAP
jgi:chromosome segregation ATPase